MPSRRRSRSKNLTNNLADVQRRLRFLERRPVRTRLANRVVTRAAIAPNSVSADEAEFGTSVVVPPGEEIEDVKSTIENPKEGFLVVDASTGESQIYSETQETYYDVSDPVAQASADAAADSAVIANTAATNAQFTASSALTTAGNKNRVFYAVDETALNAQAAADSYTLKAGDLWFDTDNDYRMSRYSGTSWGAFSLGDLALSAISAGKITAGSITLSQGITITAGLDPNTNSSLTINNFGIAAVNSSNVQTFSINSSGDAFFGGSLTAGISITSPNIIGGTIKTSAGTGPSTWNRVEISDIDEIKFFDSSNSVVGRIGPLQIAGSNTGLLVIGGENASYSPYLNLQSAGGENNNYGASLYLGLGGGTYPSITMTNADLLNPNNASSNILIYSGGGGSSEGTIQISTGKGFTFYDWSSGVYENAILFDANGGLISGGPLTILGYDTVSFGGKMLLSGDNYSQGTGSPTAYTGNDRFTYIGQIVFRYN